MRAERRIAVPTLALTTALLLAGCGVDSAQGAGTSAPRTPAASSESSATDSTTVQPDPNPVFDISGFMISKYGPDEITISYPGITAGPTSYELALDDLSRESACRNNSSRQASEEYNQSTGYVTVFEPVDRSDCLDHVTGPKLSHLH